MRHFNQPIYLLIEQYVSACQYKHERQTAAQVRVRVELNKKKCGFNQPIALLMNSMYPACTSKYEPQTAAEVRITVEKLHVSASYSTSAHNIHVNNYVLYALIWFVCLHLVGLKNSEL